MSYNTLNSKQESGLGTAREALIAAARTLLTCPELGPKLVASS